MGDFDKYNIHSWLHSNRIVNEKGDPIEFKNHLFLWDIYSDNSPLLALLKPAQVGASTFAILKKFWLAANRKMDIVYTLPTDADVSTFVGGKTNRIIANNPILLDYVKDKDSIEQKQVGDSMIYYRGCVDDKTEVLTENGWCNLNQVERGDRLPTLNIVSNSVEMDEVQDVTRFEVEEEMVRLKTNRIDQLVTKDHRCVIAKRKLTGEKSNLRIARAHELIGKKSAYIPLSYIYDDAKIDPYYKIIGWVIGDGSYWTARNKSNFIRKDGTTNSTVYEGERVCIIQSKLCEELEKDLEDAGVKYYKKTHNKDCFRYELSNKDSRKIRAIVPKKILTYDLVFKINQSQRAGIFKGLLMSDGDGYKETAFYQNKNGTCDSFQALLVLLGKTSNLQSRIIPSSFSKNVKQKVSIKVSKWGNPVVSLEKYKGIVWCPTTRNGTIFIRRNGIVSVTGQTWTKKAAIMVTSDLNIHDEIDSSKQDVVSDYEARLQHSKYKWRWYFSHPSAPGAGVDKYWQISDQKHWFIKCEHCHKRHYMDWPDSVDLEKKIFICKLCKKPISELTRTLGEWVNKYKRDSDRPFSGYWINSMMCPWLTAGYIVDKFNDKNSDEEFFFNKVLGLPYAGSGNVVNEDSLWRNLTDEVNLHDDRIIIGVDTGIPNYFVVGNKQSIFYYGYDKGYDEIEKMLKRWPNAIAVFDALGDLFYPRKLREKYTGRVFLCTYRRDQKTMSLIKWGKKKEEGSVVVDRNRMIQLVIDEFTDGRIPLQGKKEDWYDYWLHWKNIYRVRVENALGIIENKWMRSGADHWIHSTVLWRVGMNRFGSGSAKMFTPSQPQLPTAPTVQPDDTIENQLSRKLIFPEQARDWRDV